jgi:hypothetical protein
MRRILRSLASRATSARKHGISADQQHEVAFEMAASNIRFGEGVTKEVGFDLKNMGASNVLVFTDPNLAKLEPMRVALDSLAKAKVPFQVYDRNGFYLKFFVTVTKGAKRSFELIDLNFIRLKSSYRAYE